MEGTSLPRDVQNELARLIGETAPEQHDEANLSALADALLERSGIKLSPSDRDELVLSAVEQYVNFGPLAPLLADPEVTEIMVNGARHVFVERRGQRVDAGVSFPDETAVRALIGRMQVLAPGRRVDASVPYVDLSMPGGLRVNIVVPPVVSGGTHLTLRKYVRSLRSPEDLVRNGTIDRRMLTFLEAGIRSKLNMLFIGATGSGKTTLLDIFATRIPADERVLVIEDTLEFRLDQPDVVRLLTRQANVEGRGAITATDLFRNALRMRPQRILLGEIRGKEALEYLQAINSGHGGTLAVLHAGSPEEALVRMEYLVAVAGTQVAPEIVRRQIVHGLDLVVLIEQVADGTRKVTRVSEIVGMTEDDVDVVDVFRWDPIARAADGHVVGRFHATGYVPKCVEDFKIAGNPVPEDLFAPPA